MQIVAFESEHLDAVVELSLRAWAPVFASIEAAMDSDVFREMHPDWRVTQRDAVTDVCRDPDVCVWVAMEDDTVAGFAALRQHAEERLGEIYMIAVEPNFQRRGIAKALTDHSLQWLKSMGMTTATVETGSDPGHAPARRTYESTGFRPFPMVRYFRKL